MYKVTQIYGTRFSSNGDLNDECAHDIHTHTPILIRKTSNSKTKNKTMQFLSDLNTSRVVVLHNVSVFFSLVLLFS